MLILKTLQEVLDFSLSARSKKLSIGFVPTMGALHEGHLSLIKRSIEENQYTVSSLFVNPTQFNNAIDLEKYPRTEEADLKLLQNKGCDVVYLPTIKDLYPKGLETEKFNFEGLETVMEGMFRPGHFQGMATVVKRLFLQVMPTQAYFGEKDFQQLQIIRKLVKMENLPIKIIGMPIVREADGLAMSSRNTRLTAEHRKEAPFIFKSLQKAKEWRTLYPPLIIQEKIKELYSSSPFKLEYFKICEENNLQEISVFEENKKYRAFLAVFANEIRLIDNLEI